jgi:RNA polymerase sigma-70 factor (ECF subfamily)
MTPFGELPPESQTGPGGGPTDHSLLRRFRRGSQDAATQLYLRYAQRLLALVEAQSSPDLARSGDAEDIVQSVFGSFFRRASQGYYDVPEGEELWQLFLVLALNKIRAKAAFYHAAKRDVRRTTQGAGVEQNLEVLKPQADADYAFLQLIIDDALERLPSEHKTMIEFRIQGYEIAEIAQKTGRSKRTVERILQEARKKLNELLREDS